MLAFAMLWFAAAGERLVVRVRLSNGSVRKVAAVPSLSVEAIRRSADSEAPLFLDEACSKPADEAATVEDLGLRHGALLYAERRKVRASSEEAPVWDPYPRLSKRRSNRFDKKRKGRVSTLDDLSAGLHELKLEERVCSEARVDAAAIEKVASRVCLILGARAERAVSCEAFTNLGDAAPLAAKLGLEPVGVCVRTLDARTARLAARLQADTMRRLGRQHCFPFVVLAASDEGVEAFEISERFVQMTAEGLVDEIDDDDELVHLRSPAIVQRGETTEFDPAWIYRPVPIVSDHAPFRVAAFLDRDIDDRAVVERVLAGAWDDKRELAGRVADFDLLIHLSNLLPRPDFDALCRFVAMRRIAPFYDRDAIILPPALSAVLKHTFGVPAPEGPTTPKKKPFIPPSNYFTS